MEPVLVEAQLVPAHKRCEVEQISIGCLYIVAVGQHGDALYSIGPSAAKQKREAGREIAGSVSAWETDMDEQLVELKKLVTLIEAQTVTPEKGPTREDFLLAAELVSTASKMLMAAANVEGGAALRPWRKIIGHILIAIGEWLLSDK